MNSPAEIAKNYVSIGAAKAKLPLLKMFLLAVLAGAFIAFGGIASTAATVGVSAPGAAKLISGCVFPVGLTLVLLAGSELFTGDCLIIIPVLQRETRVSAFIRCLAVVYAGNFVGSVIVAALVVYGHTPSMFADNALAAAIVKTASAKVSLSFGDGFVRGILCNVLVCLAVWVSFSAKTAAGKVISLFLPIMAFVVCGFEHSVANMYYIPAGIFASAEYQIAAEGLNWGAMLLKNLLPVTLGNMVGGMAIGTAYWGIYLRGSRA